ncbi:MAG: ATP-binding protein [Burkholderiaceae bacterium]|nr:ATP-binding protein [Burkholderiaceae bacterium]
MRLPRSLQGRLLGLMLAVVATVWVAAAATTWVDVRDELDELLDAHLAQAAALLVVQQAGEIEHDDDRLLDAPTLHKYAPKVAFQVFHEGQLVLRSANAPLQPLLREGRRARDGFATVHLDGVAWRVFSAHGGERDVRVFVGEQLHSRDEIAWTVLRDTLWPMALALPLLGLAAWWAIRQGLRPLRQLGQALAARTPTDLQPLRLDGAPNEIAPIVDALDGLFGRIGSLLETERRFTADAAHELRTPIAAIRAQAQVALAEADDARRRHALQATLEGCDRATRLVEQLLTLARLEADAMPSTQVVDLAAVARDVVAAAAPRSLARRQDLELDAPAPCRVRADATLLAVLVRNLVDNAVRYSPDGARIRVGVRRAGTRAELAVEDGGPGLAPEQLARLGERFFRVTGSSASGSGLGWSIVRRIAAAHGMSVDVARSAELGGLAVRVGTAAADAASR